MNIGDKVRLLHGKEEGIIRRIVNDRLIEIEIDDGFIIPVLKNEIVLLAGDESAYLNTPSHTAKEAYQNIAEHEINGNGGVYIALTTREKILTGWIINNTDHTILFSVHSQKGNGINGISHGLLNKFSYAKIEEWSLNYIHQLPLLIIDIIKFYHTNNQYDPPQTQRVDLNSKTINQEKKEIPQLNLKGVLIGLEEMDQKPDPDKIKNAMFHAQASEQKKDHPTHVRSKEIDLHIESLIDDASELDHAEILDIQISHFERSLEKAVVSGIDQITFIHGIGSGTLRNKIHRILSQYPHIKYFEDARKEKFGYGATKVHFK